MIMKMTSEPKISPNVLAAWKLLMLVHRELGELNHLFRPGVSEFFDRRSYLQDFWREGYDLLAKHHGCDEVFRIFHAFCLDHVAPLHVKTSTLDEISDYKGINIPVDEKQKLLADFDHFHEFRVNALRVKLEEILYGETTDRQG